VVLQDVVVVEQPVAGGADVAPERGGGGQPLVGFLEDPAGPGNAGEERGPPPCAAAGGQVLCDRYRLGPFPEVLGAQQLSPDRSREQLFAGVRARAPEAGEEMAGIE
jgi:hypothetical protein